MDNLIILAIGSNLGNRLNNLKTALYEIELKLLKNLYISTVYQCNAVLKPDSPKKWDKKFLNIVICGQLKDKKLTSQKLQKEIEKIEKKLGKEKIGTWAPRTIDIDIIAFKNEVVDNETLTIPHKRMHERDFVLAPLAEILPDWQHPVLKRSAKQLSEAVENSSNLKKYRFKL